MKPLSLIIVLSILIFFVYAFSLGSGSSLTEFPPLGAIVGNIKKDSSKTYEVSNIYRTINGGDIWFAQSVVGSDKDFVGIYDIEFDVVDSNIVYAGTVADGLYKTINNGQDWDKVFDRNKILSPNSSVVKIVLDKRNKDNIYLAAYQNQRGVFLKSEDGGQSFMQTYITSMDKYVVSAIAIDPLDSKTIYMGTTQGGFFASNDYGETWKAKKWITGKVSDIIINPNNSSEIYVTTSNRGLFRTQDKGTTWKSFAKEVQRVAARNQVVSFQIDKDNSNTLYLGVSNGLLKSDNRGETWKFVDLLIPPNKLPLDSVKIDPNNRNIIYVGVGDLIYKSKDRGNSWSVQRIKLPSKEKRIKLIEIDKRDSRSLYFGVR